MLAIARFQLQFYSKTWKMLTLSIPLTRCLKRHLTRRLKYAFIWWTTKGWLWFWTRAVRPPRISFWMSSWRNCPFLIATNLVSVFGSALRFFICRYSALHHFRQWIKSDKYIISVITVITISILFYILVVAAYARSSSYGEALDALLEKIYAGKVRIMC